MRNSNSNWYEQTAVVISQSSGNVGMLIRELLKSYQWKVIDTTDSVEVVLSHLETGRANLIIVDDSTELPSSCIVRRLFSNPIAAGTPSLVFTSEHQPQERSALMHMSHLGLVLKPLTPDKFLPAFKDLVSRWSEGYYVLIRQAIRQIVLGNNETGLRMLTKINEHEKARPIVAPIVAHYYRLLNSLPTAEKVLLTAMRDSPRHLGLMFALSELYVQASMPLMAYRILNGARVAYGKSAAILVDLVHCAVMLNAVEDAIKLLGELQTCNYLPTTINNYLIRLLYTEGRSLELAKLVTKPALMAKLEAAWNAETPPPLANMQPPAAAS